MKRRSILNERKSLVDYEIDKENWNLIRSGNAKKFLCVFVALIMVSVAFSVVINQLVAVQSPVTEDKVASTMGGHPPIWNIAMQDIFVAPDPASGGSSATITDRVINTAGGISYASTINGYVDNVLKSTASVPTIYPGLTWDHIYTTTAASGYHDVKAEIVNGDNIQSDNILTERHWWKGPDLIVYDLWAADLDNNQITSIASGQQFTVSAMIKNVGDLTALAGSIVDMDMVGAGWGSAVTLSQDLAPGASTTVNFWGMAGDYISYISTPGTYTITVTADYYNAVYEANTATGSGIGTAETNNIRSETFSVVKASWTVLIYTSADDPSPLEDFALQDYIDLENDIGGSNIDISIIVQLDRIAGEDNGYGDWTDTHRFIVKNLRTPTVQNSVESEEYDYLGEKDMGSASTLSGFLTWGADRFRANNYFVILAGHGSGTGVCSDYTSGSMLGLSDLATGFQAMAQELSSNGDGNKVDVVLFKACLDSSTEIAAELSPYVDYMVGVETVSCVWPLIIADLILWQDLPYYKMWGDGIVEYLKRYPSTAPSAFAPHVVEMSNPIYNPLWVPQGIDGEAIASVDLTQMEPLIFSVDQFSLILRDNVVAHKSLILNALSETKIMPPDTGMMDLYQFAEKIYAQFDGVTDPIVKQEVQMAAQNVMDHVLGIVTHLDHVGYTGNCHGLSISTPGTASSDGRLAATTHWDEFGAALYDADAPVDVSVVADPNDLTRCLDLGVDYLDANTVTLFLDAWDSSGLSMMGIGTSPGHFDVYTDFSNTYEFPLDPAIDGQITIYFRVWDWAGHYGSAYCTILKDTMSPILDSYVIDGGATYTLDPTVSITVAAHDEGLGIRGISFSMDGVNFPRPEPYTEPSTTMDYTVGPDQTDGLKTIYLRIVDWAWHSSNAIPRTIFLDANKPSNPTSSTSNPLPGSWTTDNTVDVTWSGATDGTGSGINGYSFEWTLSSTTIPDTTIDTTSTSVTSAALADGLWYLHVRSQDKAGWWADGAYHIGPFKIDRTLPTNPTGFTSSHTPNVPSTDTTIDISWTGALDTPSGINGYSFSWTQVSSDVPDATVDTTGTTTTSPILAVGNWYFHVRSIDNAGNVATGAYHVGPFVISSGVQPITAPGKPTWTAGDESDGVFTLSWTPSTGGVPPLHYEVWQFKLGSSGWELVQGNIPGPSLTVPYRTPGTYEFDVIAFDSTGANGPWGPPTLPDMVVVPSDLRLTTNAGDSTKPAIAVDSSGNYHVVWQDATDGNNEIYYMKLDPNWNVLTTQTRLTTNAYDSADPDIAVSPSGTVKVIWRDSRDGNYEIYTKTWNSGSGWGADTRLTSTASANDKEPDVDVDSSGNFYFVWHDLVRAGNKQTEKIWFSVNGGTPSSIFTAPGTKIGTYDKISEPRLACGATGVIHLAFALGPAYPAETGTESINYMKRTSSTWSSVSTLKSSTGSSVSAWVSIDADSSGNVYVAWQQFSAGTMAIGFIRSSNGGTSWDSDIVIPGTESSSYYPEVTCLSNGGVYLGFYNCYNTPGIIYCTKSLDYGATWQTIQAISPTSNGVNVWYYGMCVDPNSGRVGVVWDCVGPFDWNYFEIFFAAKML